MRSSSLPFVNFVNTSMAIEFFLLLISLLCLNIKLQLVICSFCGEITNILETAKVQRSIVAKSCTSAN